MQKARILRLYFSRPLGGGGAAKEITAKPPTFRPHGAGPRGGILG